MAVAVTLASTLAMTPQAAEAADDASALVLSAVALLPVASVYSAMKHGSGEGGQADLSEGEPNGTSIMTVVAVSIVYAVIEWTIERVGDGSRYVMRFPTSSAEHGRQLSRVVPGDEISVSPVAGGWLLGHDKEAIAWVPGPADRSLSHHEPVKR